MPVFTSRSRRTRIVLVCLGLSLAVGFVVYYFAWSDRRPEWIRRLDEVQRFDPEVLKQAGGGAVDLEARIQEIAQRPLWDVADVDELWKIYGRYDRDLRSYPKDIPRSESIPILVAMTASYYLEMRFEGDTPFTPAARERYMSLLVEDLFSPVAGRRSDSALGLILGTGTLEEPGIRAQVERLLDDPDEEVRKVVALQLGYHDEAKRRQSSLDERKKAIGKP